MLTKDRKKKIDAIRFCSLWASWIAKQRLSFADQCYNKGLECTFLPTSIDSWQTKPVYDLRCSDHWRKRTVLFFWLKMISSAFWRYIRVCIGYPWFQQDKTWERIAKYVNRLETLETESQAFLSKELELSFFFFLVIVTNGMNWFLLETIK